MANLFGTLNRFIARLDSDPSQIQKSSGSSAYGFQVLQNNRADLPLDPWFDFVIGINGRTIDSSDHDLFATEIKNCAGSNISLGVYSAKGQQIKEIYVSIPPDGSGLGLALQWAPLNTCEDVWHILDVMPNSPADVAGLLPYSDYVVGSPEGLLRGESALGELIEDFMDRSLRLWVYNHEYDVTRMITITPARNWGGTGSLGCVLGFGALHRVPAPLTEPTQAPGETLFSTENARFSNEEPRPSSTAPPLGQAPPLSSANFLVPANMDLKPTSPPPGGPPVGKARKQRAHHAVSPTVGLDDYFKEGEEKSRELEGRSTPKPGGSVPPPPKVGAGPPKASITDKAEE